MQEKETSAEEKKDIKAAKNTNEELKWVKLNEKDDLRLWIKDIIRAFQK